MRDVLLWVGRGGALLGLALSLVAVAARLAGHFWLSGFQVGTLLLGGMGAMLLGCLGYVAWLVEMQRRA